MLASLLAWSYYYHYLIFICKKALNYYYVSNKKHSVDMNDSVKVTRKQPIINNPAIDLIKEMIVEKGGDSVENSMPEWSEMIGGWSIDRNIFSSVPLDGTDASDRRKTQGFYGISVLLLSLSFHGTWQGIGFKKRQVTCSFHNWEVNGR